jgi:hypothetical protein
VIIFLLSTKHRPDTVLNKCFIYITSATSMVWPERLRDLLSIKPGIQEALHGCWHQWDSDIWLSETYETGICQARTGDSTKMSLAGAAQGLCLIKD